VGGRAATHLLVDLHGEDALAVEDLDGEGPARVRVPRQLHLAEVALPERPPHLVLPHPHSPAAGTVLARRSSAGRRRTQQLSAGGRAVN